MRRFFLRASVLVLSVVLLSACGTVKKWFGKSDKAPEPDEPAALVDIENPITIERIWGVSLGDGEGNLWTRQAPVLAEGRIYASNIDGRVMAFDAMTGKQLWSTKTKLPLSGGPGVGAGRLVLGSLEGDVIALDADSGAEIWRTKVSSEVITAPVVSQGFTVVRGNDGRVFGINLGDGKRVWVFDRGLPALTTRGNAPPALARDAVVIGYADGMLVTLRITDGGTLWERAVATPDGRNELERMADIDGDIQVGLTDVFAHSIKGQVMAVDLSSGRPLWNRDITGYAGMALMGDKVITADGSGVLMALDRGTGAGLWRQDALLNRMVSTPAAAGPYVVAGDVEGYLHWFDAVTGAPVGRIHLGGGLRIPFLGKKPGPIRATPQVSPDGVVYVVNTEGTLGAYRVIGR